MLSGRPGTFLLPGVYYSPGKRFKTTAAILAVVLRLLSYNTCRGNQLLRTNNCSWLLHLPGTIVLAGSKSRRRILLTGEAPFCRCSNWILLFTLAGESWLFPTLLPGGQKFCKITILYSLNLDWLRNTFFPNHLKYQYVWLCKNFLYFVFILAKKLRFNQGWALRSFPFGTLRSFTF